MLKSQLPIKTYKTGREVVDWKQVNQGFTVEIEDVKIVVVSNENVEKVSKTTDKPYKTRRLVVTDINELVQLEVGSESFKKGSFVKRFKKLLDEVKPVVIEETEVIEEIEETDKPTEVIIDLGEIFKSDTSDDDFDYSKHTMTDSEITDKTNEFYAELTEQGLLQAYSDMQYGKSVDTKMSQQIMQILDDTLDDDLDLDEVEKMLNEQEQKGDDSMAVKQNSVKQEKQTVKQGNVKQTTGNKQEKRNNNGKRKGRATKDDILKAQEIIKGEPEILDDVKKWSYKIK